MGGWMGRHGGSSHRTERSEVKDGTDVDRNLGSMKGTRVQDHGGEGMNNVITVKQEGYAPTWRT